MARRPSAQRPGAQVRGRTDRAQVGQGTGQSAQTGAQAGQGTGQKGHKLDRSQVSRGTDRGTSWTGHRALVDRARVRGDTDRGTSWAGHRSEGAQTGALVGQGTGQMGTEKIPVHWDTDIGTGQT